MSLTFVRYSRPHAKCSLRDIHHVPRYCPRKNDGVAQGWFIVAQHRRWWDNVKQTLGRYFLFVGDFAESVVEAGSGKDLNQWHNHVPLSKYI